jgi:hypothetical protein
MIFQLVLISMMQPKIISGLTTKTLEAVESIIVRTRTRLNSCVIKHLLNELSDILLKTHHLILELVVWLVTCCMFQVASCKNLRGNFSARKKTLLTCIPATCNLQRVNTGFYGGFRVRRFNPGRDSGPWSFLH